jgi:hypothetical protein
MVENAHLRRRRLEAFEADSKKIGNIAEGGNMSSRYQHRRYHDGNDVVLLIDFGVARRIPYARDSAGRRQRCLINSCGRPFGKVRPPSACYFCLLFLL